MSSTVVSSHVLRVILSSLRLRIWRKERTSNACPWSSSDVDRFSSAWEDSSSIAAGLYSIDCASS